MKRALILVEGQTEETFVRELLVPHLLRFDLAVAATLVETKPRKAGNSFRGGITSYRRVERDLRRLLGDSDAIVVTTMFDFYGLPEDFPGMRDQPPHASPFERACHLESSLAERVEDARLDPYLSLHEFESLLLSAPSEIERTARAEGLADTLENAVQSAGSPELVNDGPESHPSRRILDLAPHYRKRLDGSIVARRIGLKTMRRQCSHFASWLERLEGIAGGS